MTGGTESSEAEVKITKEVVEASPEKKVEINEAAEVQRATDKAAVSPEAVVEQGDPKAAENLVEAIKAAVPPPEQAAESSAAAREVQSVVSEVSTAAPAITLEGSGAEGKVTITEAAESVAIIDSNDGSSTVNTGPDMSDVAIIDSNDREVIIDSNDGSSTVGIIDSNDGISAEAIIDSNDGVNRVADPVKIIDSNDGSAQPAGADLPDPVSPGPPPSPENTDTSEAPGSGTSVDINLIHSEVAGQSGSVEGPPVVVSEIGELSGDDISDGSVLETDLIDDIPVSGELGDPDDLNPVRERPDESPEGQAKAAVEDALEKEEAAEAARNTAERAKEKLDSEMEDMKNAMNDFDSAYEAAVDTGEELESALEDEDIPDSEYSGSAGGDTWTIEDASEETQDLYQEFQDACQDLMDSYEELENAVWSAKYAHDNASKKMDQAAQAEAEAEQAAKAARNAIAAATGEKPPGDTGRQRSDEPEQETNPPAAGDDSDLSPANLTIQEIRDFDPAQAKTDLLLETLLTKVETRVQSSQEKDGAIDPEIRISINEKDKTSQNAQNLKPDDQNSGSVDDISGELGDPDDLNPARERSDESPEGKAKDAVAEAQEKAAEAEKAEEAAKRAAAETNNAFEEAKTAQEALEDSIETAEDIYAALQNELTDEGKYFFQAGVTEYTAPEPDPDAVHVYTDLPPATSWSMEDESEEAQALYAKLESAIENMKQAAADYRSAVEEAVGSKTKSDDLADQAAQAREEAEAAEAAARAAVAAATGETYNERNGRESVDDSSDRSSDTKSIDTTEHMPVNEVNHDLMSVDEVLRDEDPIIGNSSERLNPNNDPSAKTSDSLEDPLSLIRIVADSLSEIGSPINLGALDDHDGNVVEYVSGEFGDPDDLNPARERSDESPEGKAKDAVAEAQEKAAEAEKAEEAAKRAAAEKQKAIEEAKTAQEALEDSIESAEDIYAALLEEFPDEGKAFIQAVVLDMITTATATASESDADAQYLSTDWSPPTDWSIEDESEEAQALYAKLESAIEDIKQAITDYQSAVEEAVESKTKSDDLADQAAQARAEAEAAEAAARAAVTAATGEIYNEGNSRGDNNE